MPKFSKRSINILDGVDVHLRVLFNTVIDFRDCTILEGFRGKEKQDKYFSEGFSKVQWPNGKHNKNPSLAVDVAPYFPGRGVSLNKYEVVEFGHYVLGIRDCIRLTNKIRWGGDWDKDWKSLTDNEFLDAFHWEVVY